MRAIRADGKQAEQKRGQEDESPSAWKLPRSPECANASVRHVALLSQCVRYVCQRGNRPLPAPTIYCSTTEAA